MGTTFAIRNKRHGTFPARRYRSEGMSNWSSSKGFAKVCSSLFTVFGDAWHKVSTRPPEPTRHDRAGTGRPGRYLAQRLAPPLWAPVAAPTLLELTRVLDRMGREHPGVASLRLVEQALERPGGGFEGLSDAVLQQALTELRWIARRARPTPALARAVDHLQRQVLDRQIDSYLASVDGQARAAIRAAGRPTAHGR
jgi:hypothetical protein